MKRWTDEHKVDTLPEGERGPWSLRRFEVTEKDAEFQRLRAVATGNRRSVPVGSYMGLFRGKSIWMSDTPNEIQDHLGPIRRAQGRVLIHGLGIGMVAQACLRKEVVADVTVVDNDPDVIALVAPWLHEVALENGCPLRVIEADAYTWKPEKGERWAMVWHDIWRDISTDNLEGMHKMHRRFGRRCDWQGSWSREDCEYRQRQEKRQQRAWGGC